MKNFLFIILIIISLQAFSQESKKYHIGDFTQGGIIFWLDESGDHGLVCAKEDQALRMQWDMELKFEGGVMSFPERNTKSISIVDSIFAGKGNTKSIINFVGDTNKAYAAMVCDELVVVESEIVYGDWYLPSREELIMMYTNRKIINKVALSERGSSFGKKSYWSSTDVDCSVKPHLYMDKVHAAWQHDFSRGGKSFQIPARKYMPLAVRAIRAF